MVTQRTQGLRQNVCFPFPETYTRVYIAVKIKLGNSLPAIDFSLLVVSRSVAIYLRRKPFSVVFPPTHLNFSALYDVEEEKASSS